MHASVILSVGTLVLQLSFGSMAQVHQMARDEAFIGTFHVLDHRQQKHDFVTIRWQDGQYFRSAFPSEKDLKGTDWKRLKPAKMSRYQPEQDPSYSGQFGLSEAFGFEIGKALLLKVPIGWRWEGQAMQSSCRSTTGYVTISDYGCFEVFKQGPR